MSQALDRELCAHCLLDSYNSGSSLSTLPIYRWGNCGLVKIHHHLCNILIVHVDLSCPEEEWTGLSLTNVSPKLGGTCEIQTSLARVPLMQAPIFWVTTASESIDRTQILPAQKTWPPLLLVSIIIFFYHKCLFQTFYNEKIGKNPKKLFWLKNRIRRSQFYHDPIGRTCMLKCRYFFLRE